MAAQMRIEAASQDHTQDPSGEDTLHAAAEDLPLDPLCDFSRNIPLEMTVERLLAQFFAERTWEAHARESGMNNTTRFVEAAGERYVLRIYNTHQDAEKVRFEHEILKRLAAERLSFQTPLPVAAMHGDTVVRAEDGRGKIGSLFRYMEGKRPSAHQLRHAESLGAASAELLAALEGIAPKLKPAYEPYYRIEQAHPLMNGEALGRFIAEPPEAFAAYTDELKLVQSRLQAFHAIVPELERLPHQLIHGDLGFTNALVDPQGKITAVLDFEFVTQDLRAMELAVCLSELIPIEEADNLRAMEAFAKGFGGVLKLSVREAEVIPRLMELRRLDVFVHFLGRYVDGIDPAEVAIDQLQQTVSVIRWLDDHRLQLDGLCLSFVKS